MMSPSTALPRLILQFPEVSESTSKELPVNVPQLALRPEFRLEGDSLRREVWHLVPAITHSFIFCSSILFTVSHGAAANLSSRLVRAETVYSIIQPHIQYSRCIVRLKLSHLKWTGQPTLNDYLVKMQALTRITCKLHTERDTIFELLGFRPVIVFL